jgi:hypothetical protein
VTSDKIAAGRWWTLGRWDAETLDAGRWTFFKSHKSKVVHHIRVNGVVRNDRLVPQECSFGFWTPSPMSGSSKYYIPAS